ncbi:MAG: DUF368 domain-containing protein [Oscillospiraceae bacterium]|nr:DUF368 domain-containing protein [Oscillospiraceae bacterium]
MTSNSSKKLTPIQWFRRLIQGAFIGTGAILPGISGGVLAVTFGLYRPMMEIFSHPRIGVKKHWRMFIPVIIGWAIGFFLFAKLTNMFFLANAAMACCFFIGLIAGSMPAFYHEANRQGKKKNRWLGFVISTVLMLAFFIFFENTPVAGKMTPNFWAFLLCGVLWGLSLIVPGLTSSSLIIFLGLYEPFTAGISAFDLGVLGPMVIGIIVIVLLLARAVNTLFRKFYCHAYYVVMGFVLASTLVIIPRSFGGVGEGLACLGLAVLGFFVAWLLDKFGAADREAN